LTFNPGSLKTTIPEGMQQTLGVVVSSDRSINESFNVAVVDRAGVIQPTLLLGAAGPNAYQASLFTNPGLAAGHYTGTLEVRLCRDDPVACKQPLPGSPWQVAYDITVTVNDPVGRIDTAAIERDAPPDEMARFLVSATITGGSRTAYPQWRDSGQLFQPNPPASYFPGGPAQAEFFMRDNLPAGTYEGQLELLLCKDLPCSQQYTGSPVKLPYRVVLQPATNLTPLQRWAGVGEWAQYQGNAVHNGYVPVTLDASRFNRRWRWRLPAFEGYVPQTHPVVTDNGLLYAVTGDYTRNAQLWALQENDASVRWQHDFGQVPAINPPSTDGGRVFLSTSGHEATYLWAFNGNGSLHFRSPFSSQWSRYFSPTVHNGQVLTNGGYYGGLVAFNVADGQTQWAIGLEQYDQWTPAITGGYALAFMPSGLNVLDLASGANAFTIFDPYNRVQPYSVFSAPLVAHNGLALVIDGPLASRTSNRLVAFDLAGRNIRWSIPGSFTQAPAAAPGVVYAVNGAQLEARSDSDGALLWSWLPPEASTDPFSAFHGSTPGNVLATDNLVFVGTSVGIYAVDITTRRHVWHYPKPGRMALSPQGVLYLVLNGVGPGEGGVVAFNLR
jgi:outer membrane protein assembly factor BamB